MPGPLPAEIGRPVRVEPPVQLLLSQAASLMVPSPIRQLLASGRVPEDVVSLMAGFPNGRRLPAEYFGDLAQELSHEPDAARRYYQYTGGVGEPYFRDILAQRMRQEGANVTWEGVFIAAGGSQSMLDIFGKINIQPGVTTVFTQPFTYPGAISAMAQYGPKGIEPYPTKEDGTLDAAAFEERLRILGQGRKYPHAVMVLSSYYSNPTGASMTPEEIHQVATLARKYNIAVLDDLAYRRLNFEPGQGIDAAHPSLQAEAPEQVVQTGTFSKEAAPQFRLGWAAVPQSMRAKFQLAMETANLCPSLLSQAQLGRFLTDGTYEQVFEQMLLAFYAGNQQIVLDGVAQHFPDGTTLAQGEPKGSIFVATVLPEGYDTGTLMAPAMEEAKVGYMAGLGFAQDPSTARRLIRMAFSDVEPEDLGPAVQRLGTFFQGRRPS